MYTCGNALRVDPGEAADPFFLSQLLLDILFMLALLFSSPPFRCTSVFGAPAAATDRFIPSKLLLDLSICEHPASGLPPPPLEVYL